MSFAKKHKKTAITILILVITVFLYGLESEF
ncbi:hypothetical protein J2Z65_003587 [Paenibacillus aceris]|uniref:Uncharacterized protein n=1 Tax=Paenibacillus aceris TaxID=869555 RepID=A0ABS4I0C5_9BACL|nr:hypothetical protein [Paenibacillus aceris]